MDFKKLFLFWTAIATASQTNSEDLGVANKNENHQMPEGINPIMNQGFALASQPQPTTQLRTQNPSLNSKEERALATTACQPINLIIVIDASGTEGDLVNVRTAAMQTMSEVNPVWSGVIAFGNRAGLVVPFGPVTNNLANIAAISGISPAMYGPGTNLGSAITPGPFTLALNSLKVNPITNGYPIVVELASDFMITVGDSASAAKEYKAFRDYVEITYPNSELKILGLVVPGTSGFDLGVATQISTEQHQYPNGAGLLADIHNLDLSFCVGLATQSPTAPITASPSTRSTATPTTAAPAMAAPVTPAPATAAPVSTNVPTSSPTATPPVDIVPPVVGAALAALAALLLIPAKRTKLNKPEVFSNGEASDILTKAKKILEDPNANPLLKREVSSAFINPPSVPAVNVGPTTGSARPVKENLTVLPSKKQQSHQLDMTHGSMTGGYRIGKNIFDDQREVQLPTESEPRQRVPSKPEELLPAIEEEKKVPAKAAVDDYDNHYSLLSIILINHLINRVSDKERDKKYEDSKYVIPFEVRNIFQRSWETAKSLDRHTPAKMGSAMTAAAKAVKKDPSQAFQDVLKTVKGKSVAESRKVPPTSEFKSDNNDPESGPRTPGRG